MEYGNSMINFLRQYFGKELLHGIEIGVAFGINAKSILETLNIGKLFLVDPYLPYSENDSFVTKYADALPKVKELLYRFGNKPIFINKTSRDALNDIPNNLDFVYIDGNHSYSSVKEDIQFYYPKIKKGGVLGGHDFNIVFLDVIKAVTEFAYTHNLNLYAEVSDWWIIKG